MADIEAADAGPYAQAFNAMTGRHRLHAGAVSAVLQHQAELMRCMTVESAK